MPLFVMETSLLLTERSILSITASSLPTWTGNLRSKGCLSMVIHYTWFLKTRYTNRYSSLRTWIFRYGELSPIAFTGYHEKEGPCTRRLQQLLCLLRAGISCIIAEDTRCCAFQ